MSANTLLQPTLHARPAAVLSALGGAQGVSRSGPTRASSLGQRALKALGLCAAGGLLGLSSLSQAQGGSGLLWPGLERGTSLGSMEARLTLSPGFSEAGGWADEGVANSPAVGLLGDLYFTGPLLGEGWRGGLRTTTGLLGASRSSQLLGVGSGLGGNLSGISMNSTASGHGLRLNPDEARTSWPYWGLGYTGVTAGGALSFSADLGLLANNPEAFSAWRQGRLGIGNSTDDLLRELRLSPMLQIGLSYAF